MVSLQKKSEDVYSLLFTLGTVIKITHNTNIWYLLLEEFKLSPLTKEKQKKFSLPIWTLLSVMVKKERQLLLLLCVPKNNFCHNAIMKFVPFIS